MTLHVVITKNEFAELKAKKKEFHILPNTSQQRKKLTTRNGRRKKYKFIKFVVDEIRPGATFAICNIKSIEFDPNQETTTNDIIIEHTTPTIIGPMS